MAFEPKDGSGALFKNGKKEEGSKQPDYRGEVMLGGVVYELAGWVKNTGKGPFLSLSGKVKGEQYKEGVRKSAPPDDDLIPF